MEPPPEVCVAPLEVPGDKLWDQDIQVFRPLRPKRAIPQPKIWDLGERKIFWWRIPLTRTETKINMVGAMCAKEGYVCYPPADHHVSPKDNFVCSHFFSSTDHLFPRWVHCCRPFPPKILLIFLSDCPIVKVYAHYNHSITMNAWPSDHLLITFWPKYIWI